MNTEPQKREFVGVWIPRAVVEDERLNWSLRALYAEISCYENCFASNQFLAERIGLSVVTIKRMVGILKNLGYVEQVSFDGRRRVLRMCAVVPKRVAKEASDGTENQDATICQTYQKRYGRGIKNDTAGVSKMIPPSYREQRREKRGDNNYHVSSETMRNNPTEENEVRDTGHGEPPVKSLLGDGSGVGVESGVFRDRQISQEGQETAQGEAVSGLDIPILVGVEKSSGNRNFEGQTIGDSGKKEIQALMDVFYEVNPALRYGAKAERDACVKILEMAGSLATARTNVYNYFKAMRSDVYCPRATTPYVFWQKIASIQCYFDAKKTLKKGGGIGDCVVKN